MIVSPAYLLAMWVAFSALPPLYATLIHHSLGGQYISAQLILLDLIILIMFIP
jgi:hypothetical protein